MTMTTTMTVMAMETTMTDRNDQDDATATRSSSRGWRLFRWFGKKSIEELIDEGEYQSAIERIREELERDLSPSRSRPLRQLLGETLGFIGEREEAIAVLRPLVQEYLKERQSTKAIAIQRLVAELDPESADSEMHLDHIASAVSNVVELSEPIDLNAIEQGEENEPPRRVRIAAAGTPLFSDFAPDELRAVVRKLKLHSRGAGEVVMLEDEPGSSLYVLTEGSVRVYVKGQSGRSVQIREIQAPAFFGEISIVYGKPRTATVTCKTVCELLELDAAALREIEAAHPGSSDVLRRFCDDRAASAEEKQGRVA